MKKTFAIIWFFIALVAGGWAMSNNLTIVSYLLFGFCGLCVLYLIQNR